MFDAWKAIGDRQLAALDELASGALADDKATEHDCATDLCSFWVGCWSDAMDLLHEAGSACLQPQGPPGTLPVDIGPDGIVFTIERTAEAADPGVVPGVSVGDADDLTVDNPLTAAGTPTTIPIGNVRISTYGSAVLVSLVELGALHLVPGTYDGGNLVLDGTQVVAPIRVTVT